MPLEIDTIQHTKIVPVILSGGAGSRLWPLSRQSQPKQFIPLIDDKTLFTQTLERTGNRSIFTAPVIICSTAHRFLVKELLHKAKINDALIVCEPIGRNTAPAFYASVKSAIQLKKNTSKDCFLALPADHYIPDTQSFEKAVQSSLPLALDEKIITFGITPTGPHTGYGYIEKGKPEQQGYKVKSFQEKPSLDIAQSFINKGNYLWNSGIFLCQGKVLINQIETYAANIYNAVNDSIKKGSYDLQAFSLDLNSFAQSDNISIDYAIMEKTDIACTFPVSFEWNDLGSWNSLWELNTRPTEKNQNVEIGNVVALDCKESYLHNNNKDKQLLCAYGVKDLIVVSTNDAILVLPKSKSEHIKTLLADIKKISPEILDSSAKTLRPWGSYEILEQDDGYKVKKISVLPGQRLSLQKHKHRNEHWVVVSGTARVTKGQDVFDLHENQSTYITCGELHRLENTTDKPLDMIEIQTGSYLGEDDIIRIEDDYKRKTS